MEIWDEYVFETLVKIEKSKISRNQSKFEEGMSIDYGQNLKLDYCYNFEIYRSRILKIKISIYNVNILTKESNFVEPFSRDVGVSLYICIKWSFWGKYKIPA